MIEAEDAAITTVRAHDVEPKPDLVGTSEIEEGPEAFETVIRPQTGWVPIDWKEVYAYRELLFFLIWRDISARYKQTVLGSVWAVLQPLLLMGIFTLVARFVNIETPVVDGARLPYQVFVFAGLIPWTMFSQGMPQSAMSLINSQHMITKVYFPRLFLPIAAASVFLVDVAYSLGVYFLLIMPLYGFAPAWTIVFLPALVLMTLVGTLSIGVLLAALTLFYRDFRHVVPFLVQIMMYVTPVFIPARRPPLGWVLSLNPMYGVIDAYRAVILGAPLNVACLLISCASSLVLFALAVYYFRRTERRFADCI